MIENKNLMLGGALCLSFLFLLIPIYAYFSQDITIINSATSNGSASNYTLPVNVSFNRINATTSAGLLIESNNGADVAQFGQGGGNSATFYGGLNVQGLLHAVNNATVDGNITVSNYTNTKRLNVGSSNVLSLSSFALIGQNSICQGSRNVCIGELNTVTAGQNLNIFGYGNSISHTLGDLYIADNSVIGNTNTLSGSSLATGQNRIIGDLNILTESGASNIFGQENTLIDESLYNTIFGNSNYLEASSTSNYILGGFNNLFATGVSTIIGDANLITSTTSNTIIGGSNEIANGGQSNTIYGFGNYVGDSQNTFTIGVANYIENWAGSSSVSEGNVLIGNSNNANDGVNSIMIGRGQNLFHSIESISLGFRNRINNASHLNLILGESVNLNGTRNLALVSANAQNNYSMHEINGTRLTMLATQLGNERLRLTGNTSGLWGRNMTHLQANDCYFIGDNYNTTNCNNLFMVGFNTTPTVNISPTLSNFTNRVASFGYQVNGSIGVTRTLTLRNASNNASCTTIFVGGIYTGGTC